MIGFFNEKEIKKHLNISKNEMISLLITLGYPKVDTIIRTKNKKPIEEMSKIYSNNP